MYQILSGFFKTGMFKKTSTPLSKSTSGLANVTQQISRSAKSLIFIFLIFAGFQGRAQTTYTWTGTTNTEWATTTNWSPNGNPGSAVNDVVNIPAVTNQPIVTVAPANALSSLTFTGNAATLTITVVTLNVSGAVTLNSAAAANTAATITGTGTLSCGSLSVGTDATVNSNVTRTTILNITTAVVNVTNAITISGFQGGNANRLNNTTLNINSGTVTAASVTVTNETANTTASLILGDSSPTLNISALTPFTQGVNGTKVITLNGTGATVNYTGANQTVLATTYRNLGLSGTLAKTMTGVTTIIGNFNMSGSTTANSVITSIGGNVSITETAAWTNGATNITTGTLTVGTDATFTMGNFAYTNTGESSITGTVNTATGATGTRTFTGAVTINAGGVWDLSGQNPATSFAGGITMSGTTFNNGTGAASFSANQSLSGAVAMTFGGSVTPAASTTLTNINSSTVTINNIVLTGNFTQGSNTPTLSLVNAAPFTGAGIFDASTNTNTVSYTGASQPIRSTTYSSLTINGSGTATIGGAIIVNGTMTVSSPTTNNSTLTVTTALSGAGTLTNGNSSILNLDGASTITTLAASGTGNTVNFTGAAQTVNSNSYVNLGLSGSGAKTTTGITVNGIFEMGGNAAVTASVAPTYGASATLSYNKTTAFTSGVEWPATFLGTGGVIIKNGGGAITLGGAKVLGANTNVPLNINSGATLTPGANLITLHGDFINAGTLTSGSGGITITGTTSLQSIAGFTTTGDVSMTKNAGTATFSGSVNGAALTINGSGGTLNLGTSLTHTFTGTWTRTNGTLNGGSSILNLSNATAISGTGGTFTASTGTIAFTGGPQTISGGTTFNNLVISGGGDKTISNDITVNGEMTFTSGYVVPSTPLTPQTVIFTANGVLNGTPTVSSFIRGCMVQKVVSASSSFTFPVGGPSKGYRPIAIGSVSGATTFTAIYKEETPSNVIVRRTNQGSENLQDISTFEYWDLGHSSAAGSITAAVTLNWAPYTSVTSANSGNLRLAHYDGTQWENSSPTLAFRAYDNTNKNITIAGVSSFSPFTMGSISAAALPVTLTSFTAKPTPDNKVSLGWVTSSEQVNKGFRIERQTTTETGKFAQIGFVATKAKDGNSQSVLTYNFIDNAPKMGASSFYRLVQEDLDGKLTYSDIRVVRLNGESVSMVFPNPSNGVVNISRTADGKKMNIQVIDQSGKIVSQAYNITNANYTMSILQSGIYSVKLMYPETGEQSIQRIVVQR